MAKLGKEMTKLGKEMTKVQDYVPGHFQVIPHVRPKYAGTSCDEYGQTI